MQEKRRRKSGSLYPRYVPQHLSQIDLGEELIRVPSITSLQNHPPSAQSLISHLSISTEDTDRELSEELFPFDSWVSQSRLSSVSSLSYAVEQSRTNKTDEGFCDFNQRFLFPVKTEENVQLAELELRADCTLNGTVKVVNLDYNKTVFVRWTIDNWASHQDTMASYSCSSDGLTHDLFTFTLDYNWPAVVSLAADKDADCAGVCVQLAVAYQVNGTEFWDNNDGENFQVLCN